MSHGEVTPSVSLTYYGYVLRRKWWVVVLGGALGLALALTYLALAPRVASATAAVTVNVISADPFNASRSASGLIDSAGEAQAASSYAVAERAAGRVGEGFTAQSVREAVEVVGLPDTAILRITASASTAVQAQQVANSVAEEFLEFRSEQAQTRIARSLERSRERLEDLRTQLQEVDLRIAAAPAGTREETQAQSDRSLLALQINAVISQVASTENIDTTGGTVLSPAHRNPVEWSPPRRLVALSGVVAGLGFGGIGAFLMNGRGGRVRSAKDVSQNGGRTVLGELSQRHTMVPPGGQDLAEFRAVRERLLAEPQLASRTGLLVLVDTARHKPLRTEPVNLAFTIARSGVRVEYMALAVEESELVDLTARLRLRPHPEQQGPGVRYQSDLNPAFSLLVPRAEEAVVTDEPLSAPLRTEIEKLRTQTLVMLPLSSQSGVATRLAASRLADAAVFLLGRGVTRAAELRQASADVHGMGAQVLGSVLVHQHRAPAPEAPAGQDEPGRETAREEGRREADAHVRVSSGSTDQSF